jgi:cytochrome b involved in lipid metabolism
MGRTMASNMDKIRLMTNKELQKAIKDATDNVKSLSSSPPSGPFPQNEVTRREMILLRQLTLFKIDDAKKCKRKDLECFNTEIYDLMTAFVKSHE